MIRARGIVVFVADSWLPSRERLRGQRRRADGERYGAHEPAPGRTNLPASVFASRLFRLSTMIFSGGFSSVACLGAALRMWFSRKGARRKRTGLECATCLLFRSKSRPESTIDANGLKRAGGGVADPGKMSPPDLPLCRCDALTLGTLDRLGNQFPGEFEREASWQKILNEWSPVGE